MPRTRRLSERHRSTVLVFQMVPPSSTQCEWTRLLPPLVHLGAGMALFCSFRPLVGSRKNARFPPLSLYDWSGPGRMGVGQRAPITLKPIAACPTIALTRARALGLRLLDVRSEPTDSGNFVRKKFFGVPCRNRFPRAVTSMPGLFLRDRPMAAGAQSYGWLFFGRCRRGIRPISSRKCASCAVAISGGTEFPRKT